MRFLNYHNLYASHYRNDEYLQLQYKCHVNPVPVATPLCAKSLIDILSLTRQCLVNNFVSSFLTVAGAVLLLHYESILDMQDECPVVLCYSSISGAGYKIIINILVSTQ